jgi:hypothetical protein
VEANGDASLAHEVGLDLAQPGAFRQRRQCRPRRIRNQGFGIMTGAGERQTDEVRRPEPDQGVIAACLAMRIGDGVLVNVAARQTPRTAG